MILIAHPQLRFPSLDGLPKGDKGEGWTGGLELPNRY